MHHIKVLTLAVLAGLLLVVLPQMVEAADSHVLTLRTAQGGYNEPRSPVGQIGGGQIALDFQPKNLHWAVTVTGEYYTNSPEPNHSYEIADMIGVNLTYFPHYTARWRLVPFVGVGPTWYNVPVDNTDPIQYHDTLGVNAEIGAHFRVYKALNLYALGKYLQASSNTVEIDQWAFMVGLSLRFEF